MKKIVFVEKHIFIKIDEGMNTTKGRCLENTEKCKINAQG